VEPRSQPARAHRRLLHAHPRNAVFYSLEKHPAGARNVDARKVLHGSGFREWVADTVDDAEWDLVRAV
jgi:hypothetical protein